MCGKTSGYNTRLFMSTDLKSWKVITTPTHLCSLTTYCSKLVLLGGVESSTNRPTNKVWTSSPDVIKWQPSSPMQTPRYSSSAVNGHNPECIIVAGGYNMDTVEVFTESIVKSLPTKIKFFDCTLHNNKLYLTAGGTIYHCDVKSLLRSQNTSESLWIELPVPKIVRGLASFGKQLIGICDNQTIAFTPHTQTWLEVGSTPKGKISGCLVGPTGDLIVTMSEFQPPVHRASIQGEGLKCMFILCM